MALRVHRITIKNIMAIQELEFEPGKITTVKGRNAKGKSSLHQALRSVVQGGTDATLLRHGASVGEIVLLLDDGTEISKHISVDKSVTSLRHPSYGRVSKPQGAIRQLINVSSLNPVDFLTGKPDEQRKLLLQAMPLQVTKEQVKLATGLTIDADYDRHALVVIDDIHGMIFGERTGTNRALKEKQATAKSLQESLPEQPPEGDWSAKVEGIGQAITEVQQLWDERRSEIETRLIAEIHKHEISTRDLLHERNEKALIDVQVIKAKREEAIAAINAKADEESALITTVLERKRAELIHSHETFERDLREQAEYSLGEAKSSYEPSIQSLQEQQTKARTMAEVSLRAESARQLHDQMQLDYAKLLDESKLYTQALDGIDNLRLQLMSDLPIKGLEVRGEELYLDGIPFNRVNEARRVVVAVELARMTAGDLKFMIVDGAERLDSTTFDFLAAKLNSEDEGQYLFSFVSDDEELTIKNL